MPRNVHTSAIVCGMAHTYAGTGELVAMLGVSRTRVVHLVARDDFPAPADTLTMGRIWRLADVQAWADARGRTLHPLPGADAAP